MVLLEHAAKAKIVCVFPTGCLRDLSKVFPTWNHLAIRTTQLSLRFTEGRGSNSDTFHFL